MEISLEDLYLDCSFLHLLLWSFFSTLSTKHYKIILSKKALTISRGGRLREVIQNFGALTGKRMVTFYGWLHEHNKL